MDESVNGTIIGGNYGQCWVTYQGRKQGRTGYPANEIEAVCHCDKVLNDIKDNCGQVFNDIYRDPDGWKYHFDGI